MNTSSELNIAHFLDNLYRFKELIIATFLVVASLTTYLAVILPDVYRSDAVILVSPQRLPASFVTSTVTMDLEERLQAIVQEILSSTQLEKIINDFDLYSSDSTVTSMTARINRLRKDIKVDFRRSNTRDAMTVFQLSFESQDRNKVREVTRRLVSLFINQNAQVREEEAVGTKAFMNKDAERLRQELEQQEAVVNQYKSAHLFELPDQLDSNLRTLEQLRRELQTNTQRLSTLQERKGVLQKQMVESDVYAPEITAGGQLVLAGDATTQAVQLEVKKKELDSLLQRYSIRHPDVIRLRREIESLETNGRVGEPQNNPKNNPKSSAANPLKQVLQKQIAEIDAEVHAVRTQEESLRSQISNLQSRVNNAPARAIELSKVTRGYEITLKKYQDLLAKSLESELSENMEKSQKGEQFRILDAPKLPQTPVRPKRLMIVLIGFLGGLVGGCGMAFLWGSLDTSFKNGDDIKAYVSLPLLATLPTLMTHGSVIEQRRSQSVLVLASLGALVVGAVLVRIFAPMYF